MRHLPDREGARRFFERIAAEQPRAVKTFASDEGLLSDALALAAWSPLLGTTLGQNPDYLPWLARERKEARVKTPEEIGESLARFALTNSQLDPSMLLARFRRRELLRIYLHDIRRTATLVETTDELSNLADAVLQYALSLAQQEMDNRYGPPLCTDHRGRLTRAIFCVVALGKLGSRELNYASDIDLMFLYSDEGETAGTGERGVATSREYFNRLAERVARLVGQPSGEGAAYRVDLRLRPYGRDGALGCSLAEALHYYREKAQRWELQALIRARAAAGATSLYARFANQVRGSVYQSSETVAQALSHVRLAKQKIDQQHNQKANAFNVKLGRGGIREIEFITQALQLAYGGLDQWLHAPHTLVSLGRLADRGYITERERSELSDAYTFLRMLEHRLQMEHGLQTHSVPEETSARTTIARRMNFAGTTALEDFNTALRAHTDNVHAAYERVFRNAVGTKSEKRIPVEPTTEINLPSGASNRPGTANRVSLVGTETTAQLRTAAMFASRLAALEGEAGEEATARVAYLLHNAACGALNPERASKLVTRVAASLNKSDASVTLTESLLQALVRLCGASELFGEMIASNPALISALPVEGTSLTARDYSQLLRQTVESENSYGAELAALRRAWAKLLIEIGARDAAGEILLRESNLRQTGLAAAALDAGLLIAERELGRRYGELIAEPRLAVLGLGRLGSGGIDYGSDLDVVLIYDDTRPSPIARLTHDEAYARFAELLVVALASVTRDGYLYRVDLRLRPDGRNGAMAKGARAFIEYLGERAHVWEWLAYIKLRAVAGDLELGRRIEIEACRTVHAAAQSTDHEVLRAETRRVRERLELEGVERTTGTIDIKFGRGGMLDVYFAVRYLQLRDGVMEKSDDRSTGAMLALLRASGSLSDEDSLALNDGYRLLRSLDHFLRLIIGRSTRLPTAEDHPVLCDIARCLDYSSAARLLESLNVHIAKIRTAYDNVTSDEKEARCQMSDVS
ncbi:MAG: hypothetical protein H0T92_13560 [Pyrinomonadaceae bacterium]|nr:hypothetical protein [Pyrinomonadaceae bacterium]